MIMVTITTATLKTDISGRLNKSRTGSPPAAKAGSAQVEMCQLRCDAKAKADQSPSRLSEPVLAQPTFRREWPDPASNSEVAGRIIRPAPAASSIPKSFPANPFECRS